MPLFEVGDRVKFSEYALRDLWRFYHNQGREPAKSRAKRAFDDKQAVRGTVAEVSPTGISVETDDGARHSSLAYIWDKA